MSTYMCIWQKCPLKLAIAIYNHVVIMQTLIIFRYDAVELICRQVRGAYKESEIDWMMIYDAGCTIDETGLPDHVTEPNDLVRLINETFKSFLAALPTAPTIITIAR